VLHVDAADELSSQNVAIFSICSFGPSKTQEVQGGKLKKFLIKQFLPIGGCIRQVEGAEGLKVTLPANSSWEAYLHLTAPVTSALHAGFVLGVIWAMVWDTPGHDLYAIKVRSDGLAGEPSTDRGAVQGQRDPCCREATVANFWRHVETVPAS
jgi:hypothetical protein